MIRTATFATALAVLAAWAGPATAAVRFVNLSGDTVYLARYVYEPANSYQGDGWYFEGWWSIAPGTHLRRPPGNYYLKGGRGEALTWSGKSTSVGFVTTSRFNTFVDKYDWANRERSLLGSGYKKVNFMAFDDGLYTIRGSAYRLEKRVFDFKFSSRDYKVHTKTFSVPGRALYFDYSATKKWAGPTWGWKNGAPHLAVHTHGEQVRPFGPREPGYYKGKVTVYFTVRR